MSLYRVFKTDAKSEVEGVWVEYATEPGKPPAKFKVARAGGANTKYAKALDAELKPYRPLLARGQLDDKTAELAYATAFAKGVLLDWENVTDEAGAPLAFSVESAVRLFTDLPELFKDLQVQASRLAPFRAEVDAGN